MRQRDPEFGAILPLKDVVRAIGIDAREIASEWPIQVISTGLSYAIVPFRDLHTLAHLELSFAQAAEFLERAGTRFFYFLCPERRKDSLEVRARMFFYGGEDPATGSAAGVAGPVDSEISVIQNRLNLRVVRLVVASDLRFDAGIHPRRAIVRYEINFLCQTWTLIRRRWQRNDIQPCSRGIPLYYTYCASVGC
jgi:hypothetical protein